MKTIGLIGGTGWVSTVEYYRIINQEVNRRLGGLQSAKCIIFSLNFGELNEYKRRKNEHGFYSLMKNAALKLTGAGAECVLLTANTTHIYADALQKDIPVPLIHIAEVTAKEIKNKNLRRVGLLGTKQTMELDFYKAKLREKNIEVLIPGKDDREFINSTIWNELVKESFREESKRRFLKIMNELQSDGAEGIILGCTEIPLLINQEDTKIPLFDTLRIHAISAVDFALGDKQRKQ
ncbi:MAG: aspartate/glutamate racemase family protein [Bacteroidetes bacterium]|nr:aspartate/glutamate racemase family protein [Bacteroidota bacterium]